MFLLIACSSSLYTLSDKTKYTELLKTKNGDVFNLFSSQDSDFADVYLMVGIQMFKFNGQK